MRWLGTRHKANTPRRSEPACPSSPISLVHCSYPTPSLCLVPSSSASVRLLTCDGNDRAHDGEQHDGVEVLEEVAPLHVVAGGKNDRRQHDEEEDALVEQQLARSTARGGRTTRRRYTWVSISRCPRPRVSLRACVNVATYVVRLRRLRQEHEEATETTNGHGDHALGQPVPFQSSTPDRAQPARPGRTTGETHAHTVGGEQSHSTEPDTSPHSTTSRH